MSETTRARRFGSRRRPMSRTAWIVIVIALLAGGVAADTTDEFIARHWKKPLAPQGSAPARFTPIEASLQPESCGTCHPAQLADWKTSLHARAMGPGVTGQLVEMLESDPESAVSCYSCHAPLAEQAPVVRDARGFAKNPAFDATLRPKGVTCAGCHVRMHERFGPPKRDGSLVGAEPRERLPHGGATRTPVFLRSAFCRGCHQFEADGFALNGKLLEDTYAEWKASRFARAGVQCQDCHMPDRRHVWRGIHDRDIVRSGLTIAVEPGRRDGVRDGVIATLTVTNSGVGHAFPTYVTPRVVLRGDLLDAHGRVLPGTRQEYVIEREIALDLSREISDTRLLPGQSATLEYRPRSTAGASRARVSVVVVPDAFYTRFFETLLREGAGSGTPEIRRALADTRRSAFTVFQREVSLR